MSDGSHADREKAPYENTALTSTADKRAGAAEEADGLETPTESIPLHAGGEDTSAEEPAEPTLLPFPVVGIGASAGGIEAYMELLQSLPPNTGMAFVVVPHLSPDHASHLVEILASKTSMCVRPIENGTVPEPNQVFVLPPGVDVRLEDGKFKIDERRPGDRVHFIIDRFFQSLAADQKNRAVGVILSGNGSDGALGLKAIKGEGGFALVQDPESARFGSMPRNGILADRVDLVLPPGQIGVELSRVARQFFHPSLQALEHEAVTDEDEPHFKRILALLRGVNGIDFRSYRPGTVRRRIARRMILLRIDGLDEYVRVLQESREELRNLHEDVLINVTRFFRDPQVYDALKADIFPRLLDSRPDEQQVRIWIPGCSTGEEAYSIAICLLEYLAADADEVPIQIFGTDVIDGSINEARCGTYPESIVEDVSVERLRRFFVRADKGYQISKRIRDLCIFARQNVCADPPFSRLDLISCRNILIYLQPDVQRNIFATFHYALRPSGCLLLGRSESIRENLGLFVPVDRRNRFYGKHGDRAVPVSFTTAVANDKSESGVAAAAPTSARTTVLDWRRVADDAILARFSPAGVVVNEQMDVLEIRGRPAPFLSMPQGAPSRSVLRMAHGDIVPVLCDALRRAVAFGSPVSEEVTVHEGSLVRRATLEILPLHTGATESHEYLAMFIPGAYDGFSGGPESVRHASVSDATGSHAERELLRVQRDLTTTRLYLQSLIEERDTRNQELTAACQDIQSANEELQSANEELQTAKEELQSGSEELQTVNDELRNRNHELLQTRNDLSNLLNSVSIPVILVGNDLTIRQFTPPAERRMRLRHEDIGRPIGEIRLNLVVDNLEPMLRDVLDTLVPNELEVKDRSGRWQLLHVRPYRTAENKIEGAVVVLLDIDQMRRSKEGLERARDYAQTIVEAVHIPVLVLNSELRVRTGNAAFRKLSHVEAADLNEHSFPELLTLLWEWPDLRSAFSELLDGQNSQVLDMEHETRGTSKITFQLSARALHAEDEPAILVVLEDTTARKHAEHLRDQDRERLAGQVQSATELLGRTRQELRALAGRLFTSQEEERRRGAHELHDISQKLEALEVHIDRLRQQVPVDPAEVESRLKGFQENTAALSTDIRALSHRLRPSAIDHLGLSIALDTLVSEFRDREGMLASFRASDVPPDLPLETAGVLYRIAQEALRNVAKHAGRTHVKVTLETEENSLKLTVRDFGEGFQMEQREVRNLGFISMTERARLVRGSFFVNSAAGEGTTVTVTVPLKAGA